MVDLKDCDSPFTASENGEWRIWNATGQGGILKGGRYGNPFQQVKRYRYVLMDQLRENAGKFLSAQKAAQASFEHISAVVAVSPDLNSQSKLDFDFGRLRWFRVVGLPGLPNAVSETCSGKISLSESERRKLISDVLHCEPIPISPIPKPADAHSSPVVTPDRAPDLPVRDPQPVPPAILATTPTLSPGTRDAAAEALRLRRARKLGQAPPRKNDLAPGVVVEHGLFGRGEVVLAADATVSVRFYNDTFNIRDLPRSDVEIIEIGEQTKEPVVHGTRRSPKEEDFYERPQKNLASLMHDLRDEAQEALGRDGFETSQVYAVEDEQPPPMLPQSMNLDGEVAAAFHDAEGIDTFYSHQIEARRCLQDGRHLVISTPTASGKTEAYNPTILETLLGDPNTTALYVFPLNALGDDQIGRIRRLNECLAPDRQLQVGILNKDVGEDAKWQTLKGPDNRIIVTTPDFLHYRLLPNPYPNWRRFFGNLRYVVLDESHVYRGVFGANVGNIVRRVLVRSRREGNPNFPQIIISSATVRNPKRLASQLTGLDTSGFRFITESGAPRPRRHLLALPQDICNLIDLASELLQVSTIDLHDQASRSVRTIVFLRSIAEVKRATEELRNLLRKSGKPDLANAVQEYYSEKADKEIALRKLRSGEVRCLFTTIALMAGIDIGSLDVAIVKNFPGLVMDARQMFGRAARAGEGAAIFLGDRTKPFDRFYLEHSNLLFKGSSEDIISNPENPYLLAAHLKCAAQTNENQYKNREGPLRGEWTSLFGETGQDLLGILVKNSELMIMNGRYILQSGNPHQEPPLNELRFVDNVEYVLKSEDGAVLERKRKSVAYRDAHPDAIFWHEGRRYQVARFDENSRCIVCRLLRDSDLRTRAVEDTKLHLTRELDETKDIVLGVRIGFGEGTITSEFSDYLVYRLTDVMRCRKSSCRYETTSPGTFKCPKCGSRMLPRQSEKMIERRPIPRPPVLATSLDTQVSWLEFADAILARFNREFWPRWSSEATTRFDENLSGPKEEVTPSVEAAIHSIKHAILNAFPEHVRCDPSEIGGLLEFHADSQVWRLYVYDLFTGGLGYAEAVHDEPKLVLSSALEQIERCDCDDDEGCLVCLKYFRCRQANGELTKLGSRYLLRLMLGLPVEVVLDDLRRYVATTIPPHRIVRSSVKS